MKKDLGIMKSGVEFITLSLLEQIDEMRKDFSQIAIGVFSDELFEKLFGRKPLKRYEERVRLANSIKGVNFVFKAEDGMGLDFLPPIYEPSVGPRRFHVAYVPGTYDLLHEGHLQHLLECRELCDILVVGVNSDALVYANKGKHTSMSEDERLQVVENLKFVDHVYLVSTNSKKIVNEWVKEKVGAPIDVILMGSDLRGNKHEDNPTNIPILFTERDPLFQKTNSSSYWRDRVESFLDNSSQS